MFNSEKNNSVKTIKFSALKIGDIFYFSKEGGNLMECEKLTNNLVEDENGTTFSMLSSDLVIEKINLVNS